MVLEPVLRAGLSGMLVRVPAGAWRALRRWMRFGHGLMELGGGWVVDLDIEDFFGSVDWGHTEALSGPTGARRGDTTSDREVAERRGDGGRAS